MLPMIKRHVYPLEELFDDDFFHRPFEMVEKQMKADVVQKDGELEFTIDLPSYSKDEISIDLENGYLMVAAEKKQEKEEKDEKKYLVRERVYGRVQRSWYVGNVDKDSVKAEFKDGILSIVVPEKKQEEKKLIEIK